jgi:sporulation protein YlmC with PRC-barrel domain
MHKIMISASAFLFSMALSTGAFAQGGYGAPGQAPPGGAAPPAQQAPAQTQQAPAPVQPGQAMGPCEIVTSDQLIGQNVQTPEGENLGQITGLMMDAQTGQVGYAVLSSGGVLGIGRKDYVVPWNALEIDPQQRTVVLDISPEQLRDAPPAADITTYEEGERIHEFYGVTPYWMDEGTLEMRPQQEPYPWEEPGGRIQERRPESLEDNP